MKRFEICASIPLVKKIILLLPLVLVCLSGSFFNAYAQVFPPVQSFPAPVQSFTPFQQGLTPLQGSQAPSLPPLQTTFPPSVFPPTQSFVPQTSFAIPTGSLSPWFPSIPAISCGGTF